MLHLAYRPHPRIESKLSTITDPSEPDSARHYGEEAFYLNFGKLIKKNPFENDVKHYGLFKTKNANKVLRTAATMPHEGALRSEVSKDLEANSQGFSAEFLRNGTINQESNEIAEPKAVKDIKKKKLGLVERHSEDLVAMKKLRGILKTGDKSRYRPDRQTFGFYTSNSFDVQNTVEYGRKNSNVKITESFDSAKNTKKKPALSRLNSRKNSKKSGGR